MNYYRVEVYDKWGDWEFIAFANSEEEAIIQVRDYKEDDKLDSYRIFGPYVVMEGHVFQTKQPE